MSITRRAFLKNGGLALASIGLAPVFGPSFLRRSVFAAEAEASEGGRKTLVCLFQRGAVDGLSMVVPHGDADYYRLRSNIAIPRKSVVDLDGFFGLHPALSPLKAIYDSGHLAPVQACGSPNGTRSHFDAQDYMESGAPGNKSIQTGWLTRALAACPEDRAKSEIMRAISLTDTVPRSLQGDANTLAVPNLAGFGVGGSGRGADMAAAGFQAIYDGPGHDALRGTGRESFEAIKMLKSIRPENYRPANGAEYPRGPLGDSLRQIAQLIKANVGVEVAFADCGGWDTHVNQGAEDGQLAARLTDLGQAMAAFYTDLGDRMDDVVFLTMSEFGRTARQNGNAGTDHGHATCFLAMGGKVKGGKVLGQWPGLAPEKLNENRDLALTTDFRDVFGEVAARHLGAKALKEVFPGYTADPSKFRGLLKA